MLGKTWVDLKDGAAQRLQPGCTHLLVVALGDDVACLPVIEPVQHDEYVASAHSAGGTSSHLRVFGQARQAEPEHVHRSRSLYGHETGLLPNAGETTVRANCERRPHFVPSMRALVANAANLAPFLN